MEIFVNNGFDINNNTVIPIWKFMYKNLNY